MHDRPALEVRQAMLDSIEMGTAKAESLLDGLLNLSRRMLLMKLQDADELFHASAIGPLFPQAGQQAMVGGRPVRFPLSQRSRILERSRAHLK